MSKRPGEELVAVDVNIKKVKPDQENPEGSWTCTSCTNVNWPKRTTCNRKGCNMPREAAEATGQEPQHPEGSWACVTCGNINWPKRTTCNKQNCRAPRNAVDTPGRGAPYRMPGMPPMGGMGMPSAAPARALGGHPPGSWACGSCGNVNWPKRTKCNVNTCGAAKPAGAGMEAQAAAPYQDPMAQYGGAAGAYGTNVYADAMGGMGGMPGMAGMAGMPGMAGMAGMGGYGGFDPSMFMGGANTVAQMGGSNDPPGSWACPKCNNVNWPRRTNCNSKGCGEPKPADGGVAPAYNGAAPVSNSTHPEGSWECPTCQNINWPKRTSCNKSGCDTARPANV